MGSSPIALTTSPPLSINKFDENEIGARAVQREKQQSPCNCSNYGQDLPLGLSQNFSGKATALSPKRLGLATMRRYPEHAG